MFGMPMLKERQTDKERERASKKREIERVEERRKKVRQTDGEDCGFFFCT